MTQQIAVKLPDELLAAADHLVGEGIYASRSEVLRTGIEVLVRAHRREEIDDSYRRGYARLPESPGELAEAEILAVQAIKEEPWERWW
ncbi:MAG: ribbon-helix-helix domain-containing protein [Acidimicrobiales bacterium]